jgi:short-subunit dehydrogenase
MNSDAFTSVKVVLITGASRGIGRACARILADSGMKVYGTARSVSQLPIDNISAKKGNNIEILQLDVCDDRSVAAVVGHILEKEGRIDVLVNNAGFGIAGSVEDTDIDEAKSLFETNFFGVHRMIRAVLPQMRIRKSGQIINIGSIMGLLTIPFQGFYASGKYALEALTETVRMEVAPLGIKVSIVEPGDTKTGFTQNRKVVLASGVQSAYAERCNASVKKMAEDEENGIAPEKVAKVVADLITSKNPPLRKIVGMNYQCFALAKKLFPASLTEWCIRKLYDHLSFSNT